MAEHLIEQISALREEVTALHQTAAVAELREQETAVLLATVQKENDQLRQVEIDKPDQEEGSDASSGAEDKQIAGLAKPSKRPTR
ncbi:hypothetical protein J2X84_001975 [Pseudomonas corrugata]|uniref:hypothetical protein n=1 Tax=Pseudomonas corrugata TaxID=47879 RepID=UPI00285ABBB0|nr:hypothetical protein [Pseudomonas corrugata]MDR7283151.1 hypothetical protein [Pseudomonas corrugata]